MSSADCDIIMEPVPLSFANSNDDSFLLDYNQLHHDQYYHHHHHHPQQQNQSSSYHHDDNHLLYGQEYSNHHQQQHPKSILKRSRTSSFVQQQQKQHSHHNNTVPGVVFLHPADNMKSKVRFTPMLSIYSNTADLTEILQCCWYSKHELRNFKVERKNMIRLLKRVNFDASKIDTSIHGSLRGLEAYSSVRYV